jgi:pyruvyltransferase
MRKLTNDTPTTKEPAMAEVELVYWNPKRPVYAGRGQRLIPKERPVNNFGDLLGPVIVERLKRLTNVPESASKTRRLLSVGSILHFAQDGDVIWGSGVNGKVDPLLHRFRRLDVRAVRGPLTAKFLWARGIDVPAIYGDPAQLLPCLAPELVQAAQSKKYKLTVIPNIHDLRLHPSLRLLPNVMNPRSGLWRCLYRIARSELVVGSSLHAIIVAEAFGIPARVVKSEVEHRFKYDDYYAGTGRPSYAPASTIRDAIRLGGEPLPRQSAVPLLNAFPSDLWR